MAARVSGEVEERTAGGQGEARRRLPLLVLICFTAVARKYRYAMQKKSS